jgi:hypothetical protein
MVCHYRMKTLVWNACTQRHENYQASHNTNVSCHVTNGSLKFWTMGHLAHQLAHFFVRIMQNFYYVHTMIPLHCLSGRLLH